MPRRANPGEEITQVRMLAKTVTLTVARETPDNSFGWDQTEAVFTMRNLGAEAETLEVRFPLSYYDYFTRDYRELLYVGLQPTSF